MDSAEIEFFAENEEVTIVPNFSKDKLFLIRGDVGPFNASMPVTVPVWLAVSLRQQQRCRIIPPPWMDVEKLTEKKEEETSTDIFTQMPCEYYMEVAQLLLNCASDDIPYAHKIRTLIKDIWDARMSKLRSSIQTFLTSDATHAKVERITI
ncbi:DgyrCDS10244 [Dimorphilus gyrociliatus]|uniref:GINS complex subunit 2 n=1 Tax=Dimorphilus gyrociliatus TaxID=2664684 RepID=A0A7I8W0T0_9ANNE|nr:DgyrCDS10244 [Dimorphilus gyrociliatus]